jgi:4,5-dihydroxyphthalate decarboxylase
MVRRLVFRKVERCVVPEPKLRLSLACWDYDRTRSLCDGRTSPEGIDLVYLTLSPEETFFRMMRFREFDIAEMSLSSYVLSLDDPKRPFVAIPVFPSRSFRHSGIFVRQGGPVRQPSDLVGKRVGIPEYQLTAIVWIRGILEEFYGVRYDGVTYVTGGLEEPGRIEKARVKLPGSVQIERAPEGATLSEMLDQGAIDAIYAPRTPSTFGNGRVTRLFQDSVAVERDYYLSTGIFPIMHTVAIRREVYERDRWIAKSLQKAFDASLSEVRPAQHDTTALRFSLPWLVAHAEEAEAIMGPNPWAYGFSEQNRKVLATFLRYSHAQGLASTAWDPAQLFVPESLESFAV